MGQPLVTLPSGRSEWNMPHRNWHIDLGASNITAPFDTVIIFALLDAVQPRSGGTVVVSGSHKLVRKLAQTADDPSAIRSADARNFWPELILGSAIWGRTRAAPTRFLGSWKVALRSPALR
jgi:hypothetical protein